MSWIAAKVAREEAEEEAIEAIALVAAAAAALSTPDKGGVGGGGGRVSYWAGMSHPFEVAKAMRSLQIAAGVELASPKVENQLSEPFNSTQHRSHHPTPPKLESGRAAATFAALGSDPPSPPRFGPGARVA